MQRSPDEQVAQSAPPRPHWVSVTPLWHWSLESQQPEQVLGPQTPVELGAHVNDDVINRASGRNRMVPKVPAGLD